jgi:hypothetical protein
MHLARTHFTRDAAVAVETAKAMIARKHNLKTYV